MTQEEIKAKGQKFTNECWKSVKDKLPDEVSQKAGYAIVGAIWDLFKTRISTPGAINAQSANEFHWLDFLVMQLGTAYECVFDEVIDGKSTPDEH